MKIYLFYLRIPDSYRNSNDTKVIQMMDWFYGIEFAVKYMHEELELNLPKNVYLYAITDKSDFADIFEELHDPDMFMKISKKVSREEYNEIQKRFEGMILKELPYYLGDKEGNLILTGIELSEIEEFENSILDIIYNDVAEPHEIFKWKYTDALNKIMYGAYRSVYDQMSAPCSCTYIDGIEVHCDDTSTLDYDGFKGHVYSYPKHDNVYIQFCSLILRKE